MSSQTDNTLLESKSKQKMVAHELPEEILIDIFLRLPAKSVGKCRCLSKRWKTRLSAPEFVKAHLARQMPHGNLILISDALSIHSIADITDISASRKLDLPSRWIQIAGSCDGLVLLLSEDGERILLNPTTLQQVKIQDPPEELDPEKSFTADGLGYDSLTDDYKIVALASYDRKFDEHPGQIVDTFVNVYSVKSGVWKRVENSPCDHTVSVFACCAFLNGALHWLASTTDPQHRSVIAAFRFADEVFYEIPCPGNGGRPVKLVMFGGCLCLVTVPNAGPADVWVMNEYNVAKSWTKFPFDLTCGVWETDAPVCCVGDKEVVLLKTYDGLVVHLCKEGMRTLLVDHGNSTRFVDGGTYVESLVSPVFQQ